MTRARDVATQGGLVLLNTTTISSSVASVNIDNVFNSTYRNYLIVWNLTTAGDADITFKYRSSGSTISSSYNQANAQLTTGGSWSNYGSGVTTVQYLGPVGTTGGTGIVTVGNPFSSGSKYHKMDLATTLGTYYGGGWNTSTSLMDGFNISGLQFNLTSGTIRVYGYKN